jgi:hypothetical protein
MSSKGKVEGMTAVKRTQGRRRKQISNDLENKRGNTGSLSGELALEERIVQS